MRGREGEQGGSSLLLSPVFLSSFENSRVLLSLYLSQWTPVTEAGWRQRPKLRGHSLSGLMRAPRWTTHGVRHQSKLPTAGSSIIRWVLREERAVVAAGASCSRSCLSRWPGCSEKSAARGAPGNLLGRNIGGSVNPQLLQTGSPLLRPCKWK